MNEQENSRGISDKHLPGEKEVKARNAFLKLHYMYFTPETTDDTESLKKLIITVGSYFSLSVKAAAERMTQEQREKYIKEGLKADALIHPTNSQQADEHYKTIAEGYELNRPHWNYMLGQVRATDSKIREIDQLMSKVKRRFDRE